MCPCDGHPVRVVSSLPLRARWEYYVSQRRAAARPGVAEGQLVSDIRVTDAVQGRRRKVELAQLRKRAKYRRQADKEALQNKRQTRHTRKGARETASAIITEVQHMRHGWGAWDE